VKKKGSGLYLITEPANWQKTIIKNIDRIKETDAVGILKIKQTVKKGLSLNLINKKYIDKPN
jgi:hypothetical protein